MNRLKPTRTYAGYVVKLQKGLAAREKEGVRSISDIKESNMQTNTRTTALVIKKVDRREFDP